MAQTTTISQRELKRQAGLCFEGKTLKVMLCTAGTSGYTTESTVANWQSVEKSGNGYVRGSAVIGTGAYSAQTGSYDMPDIDIEFTATGGGYQYDTVVLYLDGETYIHSLITESPNIAMANGQKQTYRLSLRQDNL